MKLLKWSTWIKAIAIFFILFIAMRLFTPSYPEIDKNMSLGEVQSFIQKVAGRESRNNSFEALNNKSQMVSVELLKANSIFYDNIKKCKNDKLCSIEAYNEHMGKWVSETMRKNTRGYFMIEKFGVVGEEINENFRNLY